VAPIIGAERAEKLGAMVGALAKVSAVTELRPLLQA